RDEAGDRQRTRRPHDGADRQLAPACRALEARAQDRPLEDSVHPAGRRLGGVPREDPRCPLGTIRDRERALRPPDRDRGDPGGCRHVALGAARSGRPGHAADRADEPPRIRPPRRRIRSRIQRAHPDRDRRPRGRPGARARVPGRTRDRGGGIGPRAAVQRSEERCDRLRSEVVPKATAGGDAVAYVSGQTAAFKDIADRIMERLPIFLLYIIGVTFIVLAMAFRSIVISATAAVTTLMSAFVGFGVLGLVVQEGHLLGLTGLDRTGPIETFVPPIAFAILFGLSMDYMVFLMSRVREEHVHGLPTRAAVEHA